MAHAPTALLCRIDQNFSALKNLCRYVGDKKHFQSEGYYKVNGKLRYKTTAICILYVPIKKTSEIFKASTHIYTISPGDTHCQYANNKCFFTNSGACGKLSWNFSVTIYLTDSGKLVIKKEYLIDF